MNTQRSLAILTLAASLSLTTAIANAQERFSYGGVHAATRPSLVDLGQVIAFQNQYGVTLRNCYVAIEGQSNLHGNTSYGPVFLTDTFRPGQILEVGWVELNGGWLPLPNDTAYLRCDNLPETRWTLSGNRQAYINKIRASYN